MTFEWWKQLGSGDCSCIRGWMRAGIPEQALVATLSFPISQGLNLGGHNLQGLASALFFESSAWSAHALIGMIRGVAEIIPWHNISLIYRSPFSLVCSVAAGLPPCHPWHPHADGMKIEMRVESASIVG